MEVITLLVTTIEIQNFILQNMYDKMFGKSFKFDTKSLFFLFKSKIIDLKCICSKIDFGNQNHLYSSHS